MTAPSAGLTQWPPPFAGPGPGDRKQRAEAREQACTKSRASRWPSRPGRSLPSPACADQPRRNHRRGAAKSWLELAPHTARPCTPACAVSPAPRLPRGRRGPQTGPLRPGETLSLRPRWHDGALCLVNKVTALVPGGGAAHFPGSGGLGECALPSGDRPEGNAVTHPPSNDTSLG